MDFVNTARVDAPHGRVWAVLRDLEAVARCVPGVEQVERLSDDTYRGVLRVKVGPISLRFEGDIVVEARDDQTGLARLRAQAADKRAGGSVNARVNLQAQPISPDETEVVIKTEAAVLGKLGEFGQPLMRKKAEQIMAEFATNLSKQVAV